MLYFLSSVFIFGTTPIILIDHIIVNPEAIILSGNDTIRYLLLATIKSIDIVSFIYITLFYSLK